MIAKSVSASLLVLVGCLPLGACSGFGAKAYAGYSSGTLDGKMGLAPTGGGLSFDADVDDDLGIKDSSDSLYLRGEANAAFLRLTVSAFRYDSRGDGTLTVNYGDISAGSQVSSDIEFTNLKTAITFDLINFGPVRISPGISVDIFDIDSEVRSVTPVVASESLDYTAPVPMVHLQGELDLGYLAANIDAGVMDIHLNDIDGTFWDLEGMLRVKPWDHVEIFGGYRYISIDGRGRVSGQDFDSNLVFTGWFVGGGFTF